MIHQSARALSTMHDSVRNLRFGWWSLLVFLSLGGVLETLHGFKVGWYVDVGNETRRLMFTLAHAHGTLLALVNIAAGLTGRKADRFGLRPSVSFALIWAAICTAGGILSRWNCNLRWRSRIGRLSGADRGGIIVLQHRTNRVRSTQA